MAEKFVIHEDHSDRPPKYDGRRCWIENCGWHLHSNGKVYLRAPEFFPTRKDAEDVLAKFPDAKIPEPERSWKNGDVLECEADKYCVTGRLMIFIKHINCTNGSVFCLDGEGCDMDHKTIDFLRGAKFLYNVNDHLEEQAAVAVPKCIQCDYCKGAGSPKLWCKLDGRVIDSPDESKPQCDSGSAR